MSYTKTVWVNGGTPAINNTNLNKQEQGIYNGNIKGGELATNSISTQVITITDSSYVRAFNDILAINLAATISGGAITINVNAAGALNLKDELGNNVTILKAGVCTVTYIDDATDYYLLIDSYRKTYLPGATASSASLTIDTDKYKEYNVTALAAAMTINSPSGSPYNGQPLIIRIKDDATARALTWNAVFNEYGTSLPATTTISKTLYLGFKWNSTDSTWDTVTILEES